jgi:hypothetical protein
MHARRELAGHMLVRIHLWRIGWQEEHRDVFMRLFQPGLYCLSVVTSQVGAEFFAKSFFHVPVLAFPQVPSGLAVDSGG